jgi:hypothetical protein
METIQHGKIWIQFSESDYQIYHNYCIRYYSVHDTTRKRSIHLFLELFEKGVLPVGEHDLGEVFLFFSKKCDEFHVNHDILGKNNSSIDFPQFQVCRDIQLLIEDFEKIYRLILKTGLASNYLMVLATFSKIIEEEKIAYISAINEQDRKKIESFAPDIAKIIRTRLGSDADWESVLYELSRIMRKFNLESPHQKIDRDCFFLIGSAVVSYFDADVGYEEIRSALEGYFEESELTEFESFLNQKKGLKYNDSDSDIHDYVIFEALKSVSSRDIDQGYYETVSDPGILKIADSPPVISQSAIPRHSKAVNPSGRSLTAYPGKIQANYSSRFDIDVSDTLKSLVVLPEKRDNYSDNMFRKPGLLQYSLLFVGFVILILLLTTIGATPGIWNPVNTMNNTSSGITSNLSNPVELQKNSSPPVKINPENTVKIKSNSTIQPMTNKTGLSSSDINKHFMIITFGHDNTKIQKPAEKLIDIAMTGNYDDADTVLIDQFNTQFNNYSVSNKIHSEIKFGQQASIVLNLLPEAAIKNIDVENVTTISKNPKTGVFYYLHRSVNQLSVTTEVFYINSDLKGNQRRHWILRSLLYELGFTGETSDYPDSIFYSGSDNTMQLSEIDWKAIQIMYGNKITPGMTFDRAKVLLLI